jgi:hypothetical protein
VSLADVVLDLAAIAAVTREGWLRAGMIDEARPRVERARAAAPRLTGAGAASIHAETVMGPDGWEVRVSWDAAHAYMRYQHSHAIQSAFGE